jgi:transposase
VDRATFSERLAHRPSGGGRVKTGFQADDANQAGHECPYGVNEPPSGCQHHILMAMDDVMFRVIVFRLQNIEFSFSTFHRVRSHTAISATLSRLTGRSVMKLL